jgi:hypothetical protein
MKILKVLVLILVALGVVLAVAAPIGPMPGFFIGGSPTESPATWQDTSATHEILLRVPGMPPRVVIIWVVEHDGELYVVGGSDGGWVGMIGERSPVEIRLDENTYALQASLVADGWEPILQAYVDKYRPDYPEIVAGFPSIEEAQGQIAVFRLTRT